MLTVRNYTAANKEIHHHLQQSITEIASSVSGNIANWLNGKLAIVEGDC